MTNALNILIFIQVLTPLSDWVCAGLFKRLNGTGSIKRWQVYVADGATGNNKNQLANKEFYILLFNCLVESKNISTLLVNRYIKNTCRFYRPTRLLNLVRNFRLRIHKLYLTHASAHQYQVLDSLIFRIYILKKDPKSDKYDFG